MQISGVVRALLLLQVVSLSGIAALQPASLRPARAAPPSRKLRGRFLHITDIHPDPFYKLYSSTEHDAACHRGTGPAGLYGAETSGCDSPVSLMNATFKWIKDNIRDEIDFVIWTGDSARHDNDERIPRTPKQIVQQNRLTVSKFREVFGKPGDDGDEDPTNDFMVPIVPTFGNNDIMPHNIFEPGPNKWTMEFLDVWRSFIPEAQRHQFQRGGWFFVEVIPERLAVFSLNTMYFFDSNSAVDGCAIKSEPGFEHMDWLRVQLQLIRERGMKAILIGHVPPARTANKMSWDETCWQKYTLWMRQFRDVVVASMFGHMNIDHFMLHDFNEIDKGYEKGIVKDESLSKSKKDHFTISSARDYLLDLRDKWAELPSTRSSRTSRWSCKLTGMKCLKSFFGQAKKSSKNAKSAGKRPSEPFKKRIGGKFAERYSLTMVQASVVPNYFPALRIVEYNITGLENAIVFADYIGLETQGKSAKHGGPVPNQENDAVYFSSKPNQYPLGDYGDTSLATERSYSKGKKTKKKNKRIKKHKFKVPQAPSRSAPPGPAYSPQTLTLLGYIQLYSNLTFVNNDFTVEKPDSDDHKKNEEVKISRWKEGKHRGRKPSKEKGQKPHPHDFKYEVLYNTSDDRVNGMKDLTVRAYFDLARRIGELVSTKSSGLSEAKDIVLVSSNGQYVQQAENNGADFASPQKKKKGHKRKHKHKKRKHKQSKAWYTFVSRAFVGAKDIESIKEDFGGDQE